MGDSNIRDLQKELQDTDGDRTPVLSGSSSDPVQSNSELSVWIQNSPPAVTQEEAATIAQAFECKGLLDPTEAAAVLADKDLLSEFMSESKTTLSLRQRSLVSRLAKVCKEKEEVAAHQQAFKRNTDLTAKDNSKTPAVPSGPQLTASDIKGII